MALRSRVWHPQPSLRAVARAHAAQRRRSCRCTALVQQQQQQAHASAVLALACYRDAQRGLHLASAGADGTLALWRAAAPGEPLQLRHRMALRVFSLLSADGCLFAGTADKNVRWARWAELLNRQSEPQFEAACGGHTGWVRALAADKVLVTVGCNFVRAWDKATLAPLGQVELYTGDVACLVAHPQQQSLFSAGADGSLHRFAVSAASRPAVALQRSAKVAHRGRIEALMRCQGWIISGGRDGALRVHECDTLTCVHEVPNAHAGSVVHCLSADADGALLSGGGDGCVRRWRLRPAGELELDAVSEAHASPVRTLLLLDVHAGAQCVCGHQDGTLSTWRVA